MLSELRARNAHALLTGDAEAFAKSCLYSGQDTTRVLLHGPTAATGIAEIPSVRVGGTRPGSCARRSTHSGRPTTRARAVRRVELFHSVQNQGEGVTGTPIVKLGFEVGLGDDPKDAKDKPVIAIKGHAETSFPVTADVFVDEKGWGIVLSLHMTALKYQASVQVWRTDPQEIDGVIMDAPGEPIYGPKKFYLADF